MEALPTRVGPVPHARSKLRRVRLLAAGAAVVVLGSTVIAPRAGAAEPGEFVRGYASANARTFSFSAQLGGANAGLVWGESTTSYREGYASAGAKPLDLGLMRLLLGEPSRCTGSTDPVPLPDSSMPANYVTNTLQATAGTVVQGDADFPGFYGAPSPGKVGTGRALATLVPYAEAETTSPSIDLGVMKLVNPTTRSETSLQNQVRMAKATMRAERIEILGGLIVIDRPVWTALIKTGAQTAHEGSFSVAGGTLWGEPRTSAQAMGDLAGAAQWVEWLLGYVGLALDLPKVTIDGDLVAVSALNLRLTNSPLGKEIIAPLMTASVGGEPSFEKVLEQELDKWAAESCDNRRYRQLVPIVVDLLKGTGEIGFPMGGVTVNIDDTPPPESGEIEPFQPASPEPPTYESGPIDPSVLGESVPFDDSSYGGYDYDYGSSFDDGTVDETEPEATDDSVASDDAEIIEFAAPSASRSRTIVGEPGGALVLGGALMALVGAAAFASERVWRRYRIRRIEP